MKPNLADTASRVGVVIVTRNRKETLLRCVSSVMALSNFRSKVVVVDNGSTDGSADALGRAHPAVIVVRNVENLGPAGGRNAGWRRLCQEQTGVESVLFFDDDAMPTPGYLSSLLSAAAADRQAGILFGKGYTKSPSRTIMSAGVSVNLWTGRIGDTGVGQQDNGQFDTPRYVDACGSFGMLVRRDLLEALGGFDECFWPYGWEDVDLCLRVRKHGLQVLYVPHAVLHHEGGKIGRKPVPAYERSKVKNYFLLLQRHANLLQKATCLICVPLQAVKLFAALVLQGHARIVGFHLCGFFDKLAGSCGKPHSTSACSSHLTSPASQPEPVTLHESSRPN